MKISENLFIYSIIGRDTELQALFINEPCEIQLGRLRGEEKYWEKLSISVTGEKTLINGVNFFYD